MAGFHTPEHPPRGSLAQRTYQPLLSPGSTSSSASVLQAADAGRLRPIIACGMTVLRSDIPARLDRLPWSRWHWRVVIALGVAWVLDGLEVTLVGSIGAVLERPDTLGLTAGEIGLVGLGVRGGRGDRRPALRAAHRPARAQEAVPGHAGGLHHRHAGHGLLAQLRLLRAVPLRHGPGHRRRIRGHQLGHRRAHSGARARAREPGHQRQLLDRRGAGRRAQPGAARRARDRPGVGLARGLCAGRGAGGGHPAGAARRARKPALADGARPRRRGAAHRREIEAEVRAQHGPLAAPQKAAWPTPARATAARRCARWRAC
jgi:hypothetical protein